MIVRPLVADIQKAVCAEYGVTLSDLLGESIARSISLPRHVAMYLARTVAGRSTPEIARMFKRRDHTTVMYACRSIEQRLKDDAETAAHLARINGAVEAVAHARKVGGTCCTCGRAMAA